LRYRSIKCEITYKLKIYFIRSWITLFLVYFIYFYRNKNLIWKLSIYVEALAGELTPISKSYPFFFGNSEIRKTSIPQLFIKLTESWLKKINEGFQRSIAYRAEHGSWTFISSRSKITITINSNSIECVTAVLQKNGCFRAWYYLKKTKLTHMVMHFFRQIL
jgi:hypothetical protein